MTEQASTGAQLPDWANRPEGGGKKRGVGRERSLSARLSDFLITGGVTVAFIYIAHNLLRWEVPYLRPSFRDCLWAIDLSLIASFVGSAMRLVYGRPWFRHFTEAAQGLITINAVYTFYRVYPLDLPPAYSDDLARLILVIIMAATGLAVVVSAVMALVSLVRDFGDTAYAAS